MYYYFITSYLLPKIKNPMKNIFLPIIARRWRELVARANLPVRLAPHYSHYSHCSLKNRPCGSHPITPITLTTPTALTPKFAHFLIIHYLCPIICKFRNLQINKLRMMLSSSHCVRHNTRSIVYFKYLSKNEKNLFFISLVRVSC